MKKQFLTFAFSVLAFPMFAAGEVYSPVVDTSLALHNAVKAKEVKVGDSSFTGQIKGKKYPGLWRVAMVKSGDTPQNFALEPLKARFDKQGKVTFWSPKNSISMSNPYGSILNNREGVGFAFSFVNPSKADLELELDGNLRLYHYNPKAPFHVYVYTLDKDGKRTEVISSLKNPELVHPVKYKNSKELSYYFRYTADAKLKSGAELVTAVIEKGITERRTSWPAVKICINEGVGQQYKPHIIVKSQIK